MASKAREAFEANKADVERLWAIHQEVAGAGVGRKRDVEVLNKSAMIFVTACWESYVEDVAKEAFGIMAQNSPDAQAIPSKVRGFVAQKIRSSNNPLDEWLLSDAGWRTQLANYQSDIIKKWTGDFNTPKSDQVKELFLELLGIKDIKSEWRWKKMSSSQASAKLDRYITVRGNIAHRVSHKSSVYKRWGVEFLGHISRLVDKTEESVTAHLRNITKADPW